MSKRVIYIDYLRIFAAFIVMLLHCAAKFWFKTDGFDFKVCTALDGICRWGVPVFVMISGALFLNRDVTAKEMWSKYIKRIVIAFIVWSLFYAFLFETDTKAVFEHFLSGHVHLWFLPMIAGLYAAVPLLKPIAEDDKKLRYFLILAIVFTFLVPTVIRLGRDFGSEFVSDSFKAFKGSYKDVHLDFKYAAYFVLGYWLYKTEFTKKQRYAIYVLGMIGFAATILLTYAISVASGKPVEHYYKNLTVNVLMEAVSVFVLFKYINFRDSAVIRKLAKYSFGAYLVHLAILKYLLPIGEAMISYNSALVVLSMAFVDFVLSFAVSAVLNQIPYLNRWCL